ncbi:hypothetical protein [Paenibacillus odorifer]|uniref:Uncharacterized protein n=1 Tax=Paenibacillus odorifer TaxID=189426 RepID=A0A1R0X912_9BACL|nr:hypothetical protein [Paenibacillus odorifer]OMD31348.1 hypothetical protein BJP51_19075 [Paenibacillus odorifer]
MNAKQREVLEKLMGLPVGTILRKGKTERILCGLMPGMIVYRTKRSKTKATALNVLSFIKWAEKAEIVEV